MNPFLTDAYLSPEYFCDRESETEALLKNIANKQHTAFFAQRRVGKTALIQHVFYRLRGKKTTGIYIDIYATQNLKDFSNQLANSIYQVFPREKTVGKRFLEAIKLLRPVLSYDEFSGTPQLSIDVSQPQQIEKTIPQLLRFLDEQSVKTVLAIDEFQQILNYPEKNVEALLRTSMQSLKNVTLVFCGSNQSMMRQIFNSAKRPFYGSSRSLRLEKIDREVYARFIKTHFQKNKFKISGDNIDLLLELSDCHTYYTQRLCAEVYSENIKNIDQEGIYKVIKRLLNEYDGTYFQYRNLLTASQWKLLKAIAVEKRVDQPFSQVFINKHQLGGATGVKRSLTALLEKELLYYHLETEKPYYEVQDKFLGLWMHYK